MTAVLGVDALAALRINYTESADDVWRPSAFHVEGLHPDPARALLAALAETAATPDASPIGVVLQGQRGTGKTHLLGWLREQTRRAGGCFVLVGLLSARDFWESVVVSLLDSLAREDEDGLSQRTVFLSRLAASAGLSRMARRAVCGKRPVTREELDAFIAALRRLDRHVGGQAQDTARALVLLAAEDQALQDLGEAFLSSAPEEEPGERARWGIRQVHRTPQEIVRDVSRLLALTGPTVVAIDQIDPLVAQSSTATAHDPVRSLRERLTVERVAGGLMDLREVARRTLTVVSCLPATWSLVENVAVDTVQDRFRRPVRLMTMTEPETARRLVARRFEVLYEAAGIKPPHPTWPVLPAAFEQAPGFTPRQLLVEIDRHVQGCLRDGVVRELERFLDEPAAPPPPPAGAAGLDALDARYARLREAAAVPEPDAFTEDAVMPGLLAAGLSAWVREQGAAGAAFGVDPPPSAKPPLHARLRRTLDEGREDEIHWAFRAVTAEHGNAALNRVRKACVAAGLDAEVPKRRLFLLRNRPWSKGAATQEAVAAFERAGGRTLAYGERDLKVLAALKALLAEEPPGLAAWLAARRPTSEVTFLTEALTDASPTPRPGPLPEPHPAARPEPHPASLPEAPAEARPEARPEPQIEAQPPARPGASAGARPEPRLQAQDGPKPAARPAAHPEARPEARPEGQAGAWMEGTHGVAPRPRPVGEPVGSPVDGPVGGPAGGPVSGPAGGPVDGPVGEPAGGLLGGLASGPLGGPVGPLPTRRPSGAPSAIARAAAGRPLRPAAPTGAPTAAPAATSAGGDGPGPRVPLGRRAADGLPLGVDLAALRKHVTIFAGSGSGKTVLIRRLVEECALLGVPAIVLDANNDLARLGEPWPEPPPGWHDGDAGKAAGYLSGTDVVVWTPGRTGGRPLSFQPLPDLTALAGDPDEFAAAVEAAAEFLVPRLRLAAGTAKAQLGQAVLRRALAHHGRRGATSLRSLAALLSDLPEGVSELADARRIAAGLAQTLTAAMDNDPLFGGVGEPVDPGLLITPPEGRRARVSVISLAGLPGLEQRQSFVSQLQRELFVWFKRHPVRDRPLGALLVMDEAQTYAPAVGTSVSTRSTLLLASQARKYGLGLVFATQSPKGVHNHIPGNSATQLFGLLNAPIQIAAARDLARAKGGDVPDVSRLRAGEFYLAAEGAAMTRLRAPMCLSWHPPAPLTTEEVVERSRRQRPGAGG
ncbi:DUF87 domain-containing protein [Actinomadura sp. ATCC 31491]|uniref:DUF87 domain-containing protein n=1 Tax=Actinomadura luzonensis TaxID=2805427 RepID=A0ABT0FXQ7_9ACTN|nr:DUF87 domain-containing protein [Actinomadura luzonensis]MCK2216673.1 DUF87 domain-containing protein [Actinomadura luzonensis]